MFHDGNLQSGIASAMQNNKAVLCFVTDDTELSNEWESVLLEDAIREEVLQQAVAIKMQARSQEADFLTPICPIESTPAVVLIKNATLQVNLQSAQITADRLRQKLTEFFVPSGSTDKSPEAAQSISQDSEANPASRTPTAVDHAGYLDLPPSAGQNRLPSNAYEALREYTENLKSSGKSSREIFEAQLAVLGRLPIFKDEVRRLGSLNPGSKPELSQIARERLLLRLPAAAIKAQMKTRSSASPTGSAPDTATTSTATPPYEPVYAQSQSSQQTNQQASAAPPPSAAAAAPPPSYESLSESQRAQQVEYRKIQKEREQKARDERERIKAQIKADREERRRREAVQKQNDAAAAAAAAGATGTANSTSTTIEDKANTASISPRTSEKIVRVQVRTFDGTPLHTAFTPSSCITKDIRPWLDAHPSTPTKNIPYDFKLILTPLPNRTIEAAEEELPLSELGIRGSCTFVIAPVRGFVDSYSGAAGGFGVPGAGVVGGLVGGGLNLVTGTVGWLGGGLRSILGYDGGASSSASSSASASATDHHHQQQQQQQENNTTAGQRNVRMRTLADQRAEEQGRNQFYNGNTLNFEPNRDEERKND